jgi:hypothetical protein
MHEPKIAYMESSPKLAGKARQFGASYRRIALVELEPGFEGPPRHDFRACARCEAHPA